MQTEEIKKNRIMEYAYKCFMNLGFSQVTMDDIARGVGMGKATVYKFFPSKESLIMSTIDFYSMRMNSAIDTILSDDKITPIDKLKLYLKTIANQLSTINPSVFLSLERVMPEAYEKIEHKRQHIIKTNFMKLIQEGKKYRLFDSEIDEAILAHMIIGSVQHIISSKEILNLHCSLDQLSTTITTILLQGCLTKEGRNEFHSES